MLAALGDTLTISKITAATPTSPSFLALCSTLAVADTGVHGKFNIGDGDQVYVMAGHGKPGSGVVFWGDESNWLPAETVAERTAARFPDCTGVSIKIYSCHSGEGGYDSFANRFARAFRPIGGTYEVTIFGYRGAVSTTPLELTEANVQM
jgi:hypothetical protein